MYTYAQTNIQLYNQLQTQRYQVEEIAAVRQAYSLTMSLFSGRFRPNGKSFIAHLIGTASILVEQNAKVQVIIAGLLHAAYPQGRFSDPRRGITAAKRSKVRSVVGLETEALIAGYATLLWNPKHVSGLLERVATLNTAEREVVLIRLANELEDHLDLGLRYGGKFKPSVSSESAIKALCDLAASLNSPQLVHELANAFQATSKAEVPLPLVAEEHASYSYEVSLGSRLMGLLYNSLRPRVRRT
ncbi:MAG: hypothetical protein HC886_14795 [Leptolyngbyaceae cyanobacterium SM1_1_3]|nr:hypothetical protein [Leptolyngbyaceae cyanobacterium SM1_1_3]NJO11500.1 hypothetical protein [Leptolyngbyaceae cyanobacterium SL_1_1]